MILRDIAAALLSWIEELDIKVPAGSRFHRMSSTLAALPAGPRIADPRDLQTEIQIQAAHDLLQFEFIRASRLMEDSSEQHAPAIREKLRSALLDSVVPRSDKLSPGRDTQAELFAAAAFHAGAFRPVSIAEPDLCCMWGASSIAVAVKRARGRNNFNKLIRRACDQVDRSGHDGIVWCDVSLLFTPSARLYAASGPEPTLEQHQRRSVRQWVREHVRGLGGAARNGNVLQFVFIDSRVAVDDIGDLKLQSYRLTCDVPDWTPRVETRSALLKRALTPMFQSLNPRRWNEDGELE
jgi:hypothetical protein